MTQRFGAQIGNRTERLGVQLAFIADRRFCRWTTEARRAVVIKH